MSKDNTTASDTKTQIKAAALTLFIENGFSGTAMNDIIKKAGVSKGGMYHHYKNKEDIFLELMAEGQKDRAARVKEYVSKNANLAREELIINLLLEKLFDETPYKTLYTVFLIEMRTNENFAKLYEQMLQENCEIATAFIQEMNLLEYLPLIEEVFTYFINSLYMGAGTLKEKNKEKAREMIRVMITAYLEHQSILPCRKDSHDQQRKNNDP